MIEDGMTLSDEIRQPTLRTFDREWSEEGWSFDGSGPAERGRQLPVHFNNVVAEVGQLDPRYVRGSAPRSYPIPRDMH
jgi:farnesyl-diphosphate farnesyltransferase